jgi:hypothetical protein
VCGLDSSGSVYGSFADSCEHYNGTSGSIIDRKFVNIFIISSYCVVFPVIFVSVIINFVQPHFTLII